jgi:hypothetical protein
VSQERLSDHNDKDAEKPSCSQIGNVDYVSLMKSAAAGPNKFKASKEVGLESPPELESNKRDSVDIFMEKLGISMDQKSDPDLIKDILHSDMKLDDCPAVTKLLGSKLSQPESMKPMLETIRTSILSKHPAIHDLIGTILRDNLVPSPDEAGRKTVVRALNYMLVLNEITRGMVENYHVMEDVRDHVLNKRKEMGIREGFFSSTYDLYKAFGSIFAPAKAKTMDVYFDRFLEQRKKGHLDKLDVLGNQALLELNITEAVLDDAFHGYTDNAKAGVHLVCHPFSKNQVSGDNRLLTFNQSQDWTSLYETWNLSFVTGNIPNPQIFQTKLLIPQVLDAKPEEYLLNRVVSLWLSVNFGLFVKLEKGRLHLPNNNEIARRWGEINLSYGRTLEKNELKTSKAVPSAASSPFVPESARSVA